MVYILPRRVVCPKCGHTFQYTPSAGIYLVPIVDGMPVCPRCWGEFVARHVPVMQWAEAHEEIGRPVAFIQREDEDIDGVERVIVTLRRLGLCLDDFDIEEYDFLPQALEDTFSRGFRLSTQLGWGVKVTVAWPVKGGSNEGKTQGSL